MAFAPQRSNRGKVTPREAGELLDLVKICLSSRCWLFFSGFLTTPDGRPSHCGRATAAPRGARVFRGEVLPRSRAALVGRLAGESRLAKSPQEFFWLAFWSFPFWLIFEAYNLHLANWSYIGLPRSLAMRGVGYVWSYATIWPAMYETADLVRALGICAGPAKRRLRFSSSSHARMIFAGLLLVTFPLLLPAHVSQYLFGAIWLGFIFLLDPINYRWNGRSFLRDWETGDTSTFWSFLIAGIVCGILWEFWNFWAQAKWLYVFPIGPSAKIFEMPLAGYLGFPAFALECFAMYEFLKSSRNRLEA
ncbi:MAG: hypothetical protein DMG23_15050, partial [Acidobacteria bacterium]